MDNGLNTNALPTVNVIDSLMGNYAGSTAQIQFVRLVSLVAALMGPTHATRALLYADLAWAAGSVGYVRADTTTAYNGVYKKSGAAGAGSWARVGDLPTGALEASQLATIQGEAALVETNVGRPGINPARFDVRAAADLSNVGAVVRVARRS